MENPLLLELSDLNTGKTEYTNEEIPPFILPLKDENTEKASTIKALQICNGYPKQVILLLKINPLYCTARWKNTACNRLIIRIKFILFFSSSHFLRADLYITMSVFPFFVPLFPLSGVTTLEWSPSRAFGRVASCFGTPESFRVPQNTTCHVRLNMNFSVEKSKYGILSTSRL